MTVLIKKDIKRVVIKIGSHVLTHDSGLRRSYFNDMVAEIVFLRRRKIAAVLVSSGAIAAAMATHKIKRRPTAMADLQALAAMGQPLLMSHYAHALQKKNLRVAQVLLTRDVLEDDERFLNAQHTLNALMSRGVVAIVNENDTVAVEEIKYGDNDQLSAHVARLIAADLLIILSHVDGLYDGDPFASAAARLIPEVAEISEKIERCVDASHSEKSVGGMATKLAAAKIATTHGIPVVITSGMTAGSVRKIFTDQFTGTFFHAVGRA